jgi:hypothetical protein
VRRIALIGCAAVVAALALSSYGGAQSTVQKCGTLTIRAGSKQGAVNGAGCFLSAYQQRCRVATYKLSVMGVDTFSTDTFRLVRGNTGCRISVSTSMQVFPQPARVHHGSCKTLTRRHGQVFATGCVGSGIPKAISLDPPATTP